MLIEIRQNDNGDLYVNSFDPELGISEVSDDDIITVINTERLSGVSYEEKKNNLEAQAVDYSLSFGNSTLSWGALAVLQYYFNKYGRRFGLLTVFHANCIC